MIDFDAVYATLYQRINEIITSRRAGVLCGNDLIDALAAWDADCREVSAALHVRTENMIGAYHHYTAGRHD